MYKKQLKYYIYSSSFLNMSIIIKRIFCFCLPIVLFTACDESIDSLDDPNPVLGVWNNYYEHTDSLVMTRVFTKDFYSYFTFANGKVQNEMNKQGYTIDKTRIILDQYTQGYVIENDSLWITNSNGDQRTIYIRADK